MRCLQLAGTAVRTIPILTGWAGEKNDGKWSTEVVAVFSRLPLNGNDIVGSEDRWWGVFLVNRLYTS